MKKKTRYYIDSCRPRTLPLSVAGIVMGSAIAMSRGCFNCETFVWAMLTTLSLQILSNLANEYGDMEKGTDNEHRLGPIRSIQRGVLSRRDILHSMVLFGTLSVVFGSLLIFRSLTGVITIELFVLFATGGAAILAAVKYTVGKGAYGYQGFGDLVVLIFFGFVSVMGAYFLQTHLLSWDVMLPSASIGLLAVGVLNLNNMRDIENDAACGKRTVPVICGLKHAKRYHALLLFVAIGAMFLFVIRQSGLCGLFILHLSLPLFLRHLRRVNSLSGRQLDSELKRLALITLGFVLLSSAVINLLGSNVVK